MNVSRIDIHRHQYAAALLCGFMEPLGIRNAGRSIVGMQLGDVGAATSANFFKLFNASFK